MIDDITGKVMECGEIKATVTISPHITGGIYAPSELSGEMSNDDSTSVKLSEGTNLSARMTTGGISIADHERLDGRDAPDQHPIPAITGLSEALDEKADAGDIPHNMSELVPDCGYLTQETDPTVPLWAKAPDKPQYTAAEVGALALDTPLFSGRWEDISGKPYIPPQYELPAATADALGGIIVGDGLNIDEDGVLSAVGGGGGGGAQSSISLANLSGWTMKSISQGAPIQASFAFSSLIDGEPTGDGVATITVNGIVKRTMNIQQGQNTVDIGGYLTPGANAINITCTDIYGGYRILKLSVTVVALSITSSFDDTQVYSDDIIYRYTPVGMAEKTVHFVVDGTELQPSVISASGLLHTRSIDTSQWSHGSHTLMVYITATIDGNEVLSNRLFYDIMFDAGDNTVIIAAPYNTSSAQQGELISIPFSVYDPSSATAAVTLTIYDPLGAIYSSQQLNVPRTRQLWSTRDYPAGEVEFVISCKGVTKTISVNVTAIDIPVSAATAGLELYLTSSGRNNSEAHPDVWEYEGITTEFTGVNWNTSGWVRDENGDTALRLFGDAQAVIDYRPFASDFKSTGKTIELEFALRDINNRDAVAVSCMSGGRGIQITADRAVLQSSQRSIDCRFDSGEKLRVAFVVDSNANTGVQGECSLMSVYLNGILSGTAVYTDDDFFFQPSPVQITIGSPLCTTDLYTVRIYDTALSYTGARDNYIADTADIIERADLFADNDIYDNYGAVSYAKLKEKIPVVTITGTLPARKGNKTDVRVKFEHPDDPSLDFEDSCKIDVQGTSSQYYVRKNWKLKFPAEHTHMRGELPSKVFCLKADYAEATSTHNTGNANLAHTLYIGEDILTPPQESDSRIRTTIEGFPCVLFHREDEYSTPVFHGKYNFNYDKGSESVYGFSSDYPNAQSWEFCNNSNAACLFHAPLSRTMADDGEGGLAPAWMSDFEARYPDGCENINAFEIMQNWVVSTWQGGATGDALTETYTDIDGQTHTTDNAAYRLAKFKTEFEQHFDRDFCLMYYVYTFVMLMVDQRAKNMFLTTWDGVHWQPWLYDNDTCLGINNEGQLVFDYYHEDTDTLAGANVYNGQDSALWVNFREAFASDIREMYKELRSSGLLTFDSIIDYFITRQANKWSISVYNEDSDFKYVSLWRDDASSAYLYQVRGSGESHLRYFVRSRLKYLDSKWFADEYADDYIYLRVYTPAQYGTVEPDASITVTPFSNMYAGVRHYGAPMRQTRLSKNEQYTFTAPTDAITGQPMHYTDAETIIYGASELSSIGDLSALYCGWIDVSKATKLTELIIGSGETGYINDNLVSLSVGSNNLLRIVDIRGCRGYTSALDVSGCPNIEEIYAEGSSITGVALPPSGYLKKLHLPGTVSSISIRDQRHLSEFTIDGSSQIDDSHVAALSSLRVENSPAVPILDIVTAAHEVASADPAPQVSLYSVRLIGIDWELDDTELIDWIMTLHGITETGSDTAKAVLTGQVHVPLISQSKIDEINAYFGSDLTVTGDIVTYTVNFVDYNGSVIKSQEVLSGQDATPPANPTRTGYTFTGWSGEYHGITQNTTITATYSINHYTVTFTDWDDTVLAVVNNVTYGTAVTPPNDPSRTGYTFAGWDHDLSAISGDTTVQAVYTINSYTVIFNIDGVLDIRTCTYGDTITAPTAEKTSDQPGIEYHFEGWQPQFNSTVTESVTYTAIFTERAARLYLYKDGDAMPGSIAGGWVLSHDNANCGTSVAWSGLTVLQDLSFAATDTVFVRSANNVDLSGYSKLCSLWQCERANSGSNLRTGYTYTAVHGVTQTSTGTYLARADYSARGTAYGAYPVGGDGTVEETVLDISGVSSGYIRYAQGAVSGANDNRRYIRIKEIWLEE